jgi:ribose 5-phosphate isomerase A
MSADDFKRQAAAKALEFVEPGMKLGLGTGSTAKHFVDLLGARVKAGLKVQQAEALGIPLTTLDDVLQLDLTVDGADEFDSDLRLIKGGGGALLREKIVAAASDRMIVIADASKHVRTLGAYPLPVEVVRFGAKTTRSMIEELAADAGCAGDITLRLKVDGQPFVTDGGNYIYDCAFGSIEEPELLDEALKIAPGVVEHGLFLGLADLAIVGSAAGVELIEAGYHADDEA